MKNKSDNSINTAIFPIRNMQLMAQQVALLQGLWLQDVSRFFSSTSKQAIWSSY